MTNEQKTVVDSLRSQGLGYKRIAAQTGISVNTVKSYLRKYAPAAAIQDASTAIPEHELEKAAASQFLCRYCGKPVAQNPGRKVTAQCSPVRRTKK